MSDEKDGNAVKRQWPKKKKREIYFEIGRVCLINFGEDAGKVCVILDFVDSTRALVDGPKSQTGVRRQTIPFTRLSIVPIKIKIIRACRSIHLEKAFIANKVAEKFAKLPWAKKIARSKIRASLSDFDRFKVMVLKKKRSLLIRQKLNEIQGWRKAAATYKAGGEGDNLDAALKLVRGFHRYHSGYKPLKGAKPAPLTEDEAKLIPLLNIPGKGFKIKPRSGKRSKKRSAAKRAAYSAYRKAMAYKRKQTVRKVKREDKVRIRTRITKAAKRKRKFKGLQKIHTEGQYKAHKNLNKQRRRKLRRQVKVSRKVKARAAEKVRKEELAAKKASPDYKKKAASAE